MAHTPGPWKIDEPYRNEVYIIGANGRTVVAFVNHNDDERKEQAADARLIASAPDLLRQRDELAAASRSGVEEMRHAEKFWNVQASLSNDMPDLKQGYLAWASRMEKAAQAIEAALARLEPKQEIER